MSIASLTELSTDCIGVAHAGHSGGGSSHLENGRSHLRQDLARTSAAAQRHLVAAQRWKFHPFETTDGFSKVVGTMAVTFKMQ